MTSALKPRESTDVLTDDRHRPSTQEQQPDDGAGVVAHERHVRRLDRDVRARATHRDADIGGSERGRVVHAVAHHRDDAVLLLEVSDRASSCPRAAGGRGTR